MNQPDCGMEDYKQTIIKMVSNINDCDILKRIYALASYLYIHSQKRQDERIDFYGNFKQ